MDQRKNQKQKILIDRFRCLNNYGSGMMGLVVLNELHKRLGDKAEFYFPSNGFSSIEEIQSELPGEVPLYIHKEPEIQWSRYKWGRSLQKRKYLVDISEIKHYDTIIVLGGDDLSEYYTDKIYRDLLKYWRWSISKRVVLLGQSMGPFENRKNRFVIKYLYRKIPVFARDEWTTRYLKEEFGLEKNVFQSADLAFMDLPLQHDRQIESEILNRYRLEPNRYLTFVLSGLAGKYYTKDKAEYFRNFQRIIEYILQDARFEGDKIVLLAHTFPPHADEGKLIKEFMEFVPRNLHEKLVPVTEKILQTRARFILGNGKLTVTGRMHAAVSTFQMGKPAVSLSYSAKYQGVIGRNLNRSDLIIEADNDHLWKSGEIAGQVINKINYVLENYERLQREIQAKVRLQKQRVKESFDRLSGKQPIHP